MMNLEAKALFDQFGRKLKTGKREFYRKIRAIKEGDIYAVDYPSAHKWGRACRYRTSYNELAMLALSELLECSGVESIDASETRNGEYVDYLNVGDPYIPTVVRCTAWTHEFRIARGGYAEFVK